MAVTITVADLEQPKGELANSFFPDGDLAAKLAGWLTAATAKVEANADIAPAAQNNAAGAWVYYLAYSYIADRIAASPNRQSIQSGEISEDWGQDRPAYWLARAEAKLSTYEQLEATPADLASTKPRASGAIQTRIYF